MKSKQVTRAVPRLLAVVALAVVISPAFLTEQAEAASGSSKSQAPFFTLNGPVTFNSTVFFGKIFNFENWFNAKQEEVKQEETKQEKQEEKQEKKEQKQEEKQEKKEQKQEEKQEKKEQKKDKQEYDSIVHDATQRLIHLRNESKSELLSIAIEAKDTKDLKEKTRLYNLGVSKFSEKEAEFNAIIQEVTEKLQSNGFSTEIVDQYKAEFDKEVELGKSLLGNLVK